MNGLAKRLTTPDLGAVGRSLVGVILAAVAAGRSELLRMRQAGDIDDETLHSLERDLDIEEVGALDSRV